MHVCLVFSWGKITQCKWASNIRTSLDTQLADRTSRVTTPAVSQPAASSSQASLAKDQPPGELGPSLQEVLAETRADLSDAQRSRSELQDKLNRVSADLEKLRKRSTQDARRISILE